MPGPWASVGVQLKTPVVLLIVAPVGMAPGAAPSARLKVSVLAGRSASVALASKVMRVPSSPDWLPISARTGATLTGAPVTTRVSKLDVADALPWQLLRPFAATRNVVVPVGVVPAVVVIVSVVAWVTLFDDVSDEVPNTAAAPAGSAPTMARSTVHALLLPLNVTDSVP